MQTDMYALAKHTVCQMIQKKMNPQRDADAEMDIHMKDIIMKVTFVDVIITMKDISRCKE